MICNHAEHGAACTVCDGEIRLRQTGERTFKLDSRITYTGDYTHPDGRDLDESWRTVGPNFETDLASVPSVMRWMVNTYGRHTPAALIHDKLIPSTSDDGHAEEVEADRFFRHMMGELGVSFSVRWIMWAGVAIRTRWEGGRLRQALLLLWCLLSFAGLAMFVGGLLTGSLALTIASVAMIPVASALWGAQWGVGVIGAVAVPFLLPAVLVIGVAVLAGSAANEAVERNRPQLPSTRPATT